MSPNHNDQIKVPHTKIIHYPLCPLSRFIRLILSEYKYPFNAIEEPFWEERDNFLRLNPAGTVPILIIPHKKHIICDVYPIFEYITESNQQTIISLLPTTHKGRAETRRLLAWFNNKFYTEISYPLLNERVIKRITRSGYPNADMIRRALQLLPHHIHYMAKLLEDRTWLAGDTLSAADFAAAAHISVVDFLGNILWADPKYKESYEIVRDWYAKIKSRASFRELTMDYIKGFSPPEHYANPDF